MSFSQEQFFLQQLSLTLSSAYAKYKPTYDEELSHATAQFWARQFAHPEKQALFETVWVQVYRYHQTVREAAEQSLQRGHMGSCIDTIASGLVHVGATLVRSPFGYGLSQAWPSLNEFQERRVTALTVQCTALIEYPLSTYFLIDGTWKTAMTWVVRGLDQVWPCPDTKPEEERIAQLSGLSGMSKLLCSWYLLAGKQEVLSSCSSFT